MQISTNGLIVGLGVVGALDPRKWKGLGFLGVSASNPKPPGPKPRMNH